MKKGKQLIKVSLVSLFSLFSCHPYDGVKKISQTFVNPNVTDDTDSPVSDTFDENISAILPSSRSDEETANITPEKKREILCDLLCNVARNRGHWADREELLNGFFEKYNANDCLRLDDEEVKSLFSSFIEAKNTSPVVSENPSVQTNGSEAAGLDIPVLITTTPPMSEDANPQQNPSQQNPPQQNPPELKPISVTAKLTGKGSEKSYCLCGGMLVPYNNKCSLVLHRKDPDDNRQIRFRWYIGKRENDFSTDLGFSDVFNLNKLAGRNGAYIGVRIEVLDPDSDTWVVLDFLSFRIEFFHDDWVLVRRFLNLFSYRCTRINLEKFNSNYKFKISAIKGYRIKSVFIRPLKNGDFPVRRIFLQNIVSLRPKELILQKSATGEDREEDNNVFAAEIRPDSYIMLILTDELGTKEYKTFIAVKEH